MRFVLLALSRPLTVVIALIAVALASVLALQRMPVDIFPQVGDPVIYVSQPYGGMDPQQMEGYLTYYYEYHFLYITGIDHVESRSIAGQALLKLVFHQGTDMASAMGETMGYVTRARAFMPTGTVPPFITRFDTGSVAIAQLIFSSPSRTQGDLQDIALNRVRPLFATLEGVSAPPPFGGAQRTIVITLNPDKLQQYRISPEEAIAAINKGTVIQPAGDLRTGKLDRIARTNATLGGNLAELLDTPIRPVSGTTVFLRDIGTIENGTDILTAYAHVNGKRTVYIPVTKRPDASTLAVINRVKAAIPDFKKAAPEDVDIRLEFDQSPFVANSIRGLVTEGLLGALLTGLMVLLFLRGGRRAAVICSTVARGGFRDDRVVPAVEQPRPGLFDLVDAGSASGRRRRRTVRPPEIILSELSWSRTPAALAAGDRLSGRLDRLLVLHLSTDGSRTLSGYKQSVDAYSLEGACRNASGRDRADGAPWVGHHSS